jgi:poly(ADP-ribose) glycohydrolase ARH3
VDLFDRRLGSVLAVFCGDALGMPFELSPIGSAPDPLDFYAGRWGGGSYTDDTELTMALMEALIAAGDVLPTEEAIAATFLAVARPAYGYGKGMRRLLELWREGAPVNAAATMVYPEGSLGNGGAMRIAPVALSYDGAQLWAAVARVTRLTHAHPLGLEGAQVQAHAVNAALHDRDILRAARGAAQSPTFAGSLALVAEALREDWTLERVAAEIGNGTSAPGSVPSAIWAALAGDSVESAITLAVRLGGDADTLGAMAGAIAGAKHGANAIPTRWLDGLENGSRGRDYLIALAHKLWA